MVVAPSNLIWLLALLPLSYAAGVSACNGGMDVVSFQRQESCPIDLALSGDTKAAMNCVEKNLHNPALRRYWSQISAENGDPIGQYNFAMELLSENGVPEKRRAIYWLERSASQGNDLAKETLSDIRSNPDSAIPLAPPGRR